MSILAVVGMKREARIISGSGINIVIGGDGSHLSARLNVAWDDQVRCVISVGIAGALSPDLAVGDCVIADTIVNDAERFVCDAGWAERLAKLIPNASIGAIATVRAPAASIQAKTALRAETGASAVDMESDIAARFAADRKLPFAALRIISDAASDMLPPAVMTALDADGGVKLGAVLLSILKTPSQIPSLIGTGKNASRALDALLRCRNLLGVGLGCPYLG